MNGIIIDKMIDKLGISRSSMYLWTEWLDLSYDIVNGIRYYKKTNKTNYIFKSILLAPYYDLKPFYSIPQLALKLGKTPPTLTKIISNSNIPVRYINSRPYVWLSDLVKARVVSYSNKTKK